MEVPLYNKGKLNPGMLKLDLFCKGITIDESCNLAEDGRHIMRLRAGLGSGLEVELPEGLWVNIPVLEYFASASPYSFRLDNGEYSIWREEEKVVDVKMPKRPEFYDRKTSSGKLMKRIGQLQGTYLGIYASKSCSFWTKYEGHNCRFCSTGLNIGPQEEEDKAIQDVLDIVKAAREEEGITFVHFNTGFFDGTGAESMIPYVEAVVEEVGLLVGVQCPPAKDFSVYDKLKEAGCDHMSFCYEIHDPKIFADCCPGKAKYLSQQLYFDAIEYCCKLYEKDRFGRGHISGEIIAGIEPYEKTHEAIDWITSVGAFPTVCVFRPIPGTNYGDWPSPNTEDMIPVFAHMYEACMENNIPLGLAPNLEISIVIQPKEGRYFLDNRNKYRAQEMKLSLARQAVKLVFNNRVKAAQKRAAKKTAQAES